MMIIQVMLLMLMMIITLGNQTPAKVQEARLACGLALSECTPMRLQFDLIMTVIMMIMVSVIIIMITTIRILMARMIQHHGSRHGCQYDDHDC